jgi:hypothetical protein
MWSSSPRSGSHPPCRSLLAVINLSRAAQQPSGDHSCEVSRGHLEDARRPDPFDPDGCITSENGVDDCVSSRRDRPTVVIHDGDYLRSPAAPLDAASLPAGPKVGGLAEMNGRASGDGAYSGVRDEGRRFKSCLPDDAGYGLYEPFGLMSYQVSKYGPDCP